MPGEFSISEAPIGDTLSGAAIFGPSFQFTSTDVKYRYGERYASEATNRKFLGIPLGTYLGFTPNFENNILTLSVDPEFGYSLARLASIDDPLYIVDVILEEDAVLDFSNHNLFPVNVVLRVSGKLGFPHAAQIVTQTASPTYPTGVLIGVVTGANIIDISEPFNRSTPYAYAGTPLGYGFMKSGAVEELLAAISANAEVLAARTDLAGVTHPDLRTRLETDASASATADRLGKEILTLPAGEFVIAAPASSVNISRAFSAYHRNLLGLEPVEDFEGFASETRVGAITSGNVPEPPPAGALTDVERNVCAIIDATSEARLVDANRQVAYGRLTYSQFGLSGSGITFNFSTMSVSGTGTLFTSQIESGDIIQDPISGEFFEVGSVTSDTSLDLTVNFPYVTTPPATAPTVRRRFTANIVTRTGPASETEFFAPASTLRIFFNAWRSIESSDYDYATELFRYFEEPPTPAATTTSLGGALNVAGLTEAKAGAIYAVRQNPVATQVGPNHIHSIDFDGGANPEVSNVVTVTMRGPTGITGQPGMGGVPGPDGLQGPQGQGFDTFIEANLFAPSGVYDHLMLGPGVEYTVTWTFPGGSNMLFLTGGMAEWRVNSPFVDFNDYFDILDIFFIGGTSEARMRARVPLAAAPASVFRYYFNASVT